MKLVYHMDIWKYYKIFKLNMNKFYFKKVFKQSISLFIWNSLLFVLFLITWFNKNIIRFKIYALI